MKVRMTRCRKEHLEETGFHRFRRDRRTELTSKALMQYLAAQRLDSKLTAVYTPNQNGVSERTIQTVVNIANRIMQDASAQRSIWVDTVSIAVYLKNRLPTVTAKAIPQESFYGKKRDPTHLKVWRDMAFTKVLASTGKFEMKAEKVMFVRYTATSKNIRIYVPGKRTITVTRDLVFIATLSFFDKKDTEDPPLVKIPGLPAVFDQIHEIELSQETIVE